MTFRYSQPFASGRAFAFGASTTIALYILPSILSGFQRELRQCGCATGDRNSEYILNALLNHEVDIGIIEVDNKLTTVSYNLL